MRTPPIVPEDREQLFGQHHVAIFAAFALPHVDDHALAVDIFRRQGDGLRDAQTRRIDGDEDGSHLEISARLQQAHDFVARQNGWQGVWPCGASGICSATFGPRASCRRRTVSRT